MRLTEIVNVKPHYPAGTVGAEVNEHYRRLVDRDGQAHWVGDVTVGRWGGGSDKITSLEGCPDLVTRDLEIRGCPNLKSLKFAPRTILGKAQIVETGITDFHDSTLGTIMGDLDLGENIHLTSLEGMPTMHGDELRINETGIRNIDGLYEACSSLTKLIVSSCKQLENINDLPSTVLAISLANCPKLVFDLDDLPIDLHILSMGMHDRMPSLSGIHKFKNLERLHIFGNKLPPNMLGIAMLPEGCDIMFTEQENKWRDAHHVPGPDPHIVEIFKTYIGTGKDKIFEFQKALIDAGLEAQAKL